jgi:hypothetical protein
VTDGSAGGDFASLFEDPVFRAYCVEHYDMDDDGRLSIDELIDRIGSETRLDVSGLSIASLKGIRNFTALEYLYCNDNNLDELNVSNNTRLSYLNCNNNRLTEIYISNNTNTALTQLHCSDNKLTELYVMNFPNLGTLDCADNSLAELFVSNCTKLTSLDCRNNSIVRLNIRVNNSLKELHCEGNSSNAQGEFRVFVWFLGAPSEQQGVNFTDGSWNVGGRSVGTLYMKSYEVGEQYPNSTSPKGVIFWVDPTSENYDPYTPSYCPNGLFVGMDEALRTWGPNRQEHFSKIPNPTGLENMRELMANRGGFGEYPAFAWVHGKNPSGTTYASGKKNIWYFPDRAELEKLVRSWFHDKEGFNAKLTTPITDGDYWGSDDGTSDGHARGRSIGIIGSGMMVGSTSKSYSLRVRALMAF